MVPVLEVGVVEDVVDAGADVQLHSFSNAEVLAEGKVGREEAGATVLVPHLGREVTQAVGTDHVR